MRGIIFLIVLSGSIGCQTNAPRPPVIHQCGLVTPKGGRAYMYCQNSDGSGTKWKSFIDELPDKPNEKYACTDADSYATAQNYFNELNRWMNQHCN